MKRSELILNITRKLEESDGSWSNKALVDFIISLAEDHGMKAPPVEDLAYKHYYGHDHDYEPIFLYEWDKE